MGARGTINCASLALLCILIGFLLCAHSAGAQENRDRVLPGCGICFPGGYDINTVGEVQGTVLELQTPVDGPVRLVVVGERERWVVLASPLWFWKSAGFPVAPGDTVTVPGSKTIGSDGTLYVIARELRVRGKGTSVILRDRRGTPLWNGSRHGRIPPRDGAACSGQGMGGRSQ